jgi:hypothetical protein
MGRVPDPAKAAFPLRTTIRVKIHRCLLPADWPVRDSLISWKLLFARFFFRGYYEPCVRHGTPERHPPLTGPADPVVLQWPSTASSGRRLTRTTFGGLYEVFLPSPIFLLSFIAFWSLSFLARVLPARRAASGATLTSSLQNRELGF